MTSDPYTPEVRALFANPAHGGRLDGAPFERLEEQGVRLELSARSAGGRIAAMRFRAWGCPHFIAAAERLCALCEGGEIGDLERVSAAELARGLGVPVEKTGRILVLEDAARRLGSRLRQASRPT